MQRYWVVVAFVIIAYGLVIGNFYILSTLYPGIMEVMDFSYAEVAAMFTGVGISHLIMLLPAGAIVDRIGARNCMVLGMSLVGASNFLFSLHLGFWQMFVFYLLLGVGVALSWVPVIVILYEQVPIEKLATGLGVMNSGGILLTGFIFGGFAPAIADVFGLWIPFQFFSTLLLAFAALFWVFVKKRLRAKPPSKVTMGPLDKYAHVLSHRGVWVLGIIGLCYTYVIITLVTFLPVYLVDVSGATIVEAGVIVFITFSGGALASILGGIAGDKIGVLKTITVGCIAGGSICILAMTTIREFWLLALIAMLIGFGPRCAYGAYYKVIPMLNPPIPEGRIGLTTGLVNVIQWSPMVFAPIVGGILLDVTGSFASLYTLATIITLSGAILYPLMKVYYKL